MRKATEYLNKLNFNYMKYTAIENVGFQSKGSIATVKEVRNGLVYFTWDNEDEKALLYSGINTFGEDIFNKRFEKIK